MMYGADIGNEFNVNIKELSKFISDKHEQFKNRKIEDMNIVEQKLFMASQMGKWMVQEVFDSLRNPVERNDLIKENYQ